MDSIPMDEMTGAADTLTKAIRPPRSTHTCRWGQSTLFLSYPEWLTAWDTPWSCRHPAHPGPLETVDTCTTCPDWNLPEGSGARRRTSADRTES